MLDKASFMETLREVGEIIKVSDVPLSKEEILNYFKEYDLDDTKKEMIFNYLLSPQEESKDTSNDDVNEENSENVNLDEDNSDDALTKIDDLMPKSVMFQMYLEELSQIKEYSSEQVEDMCKRLCEGDESVINCLSEALLSKVYDMAKKHLSEKYNLEDVIQEGNMGLFLELSRICEEKEQCNVLEKVSEQIESCMKAYICEVTGEEDSEKTVLGKAQLVSEARKYLTEQNGTIPSDIELAQFTKLELDELNDIINLIDNANV